MKGFTLSNRNNHCPVCEDTTGKCRQGREDQDYWLCMSFADIQKGQIHNGFKCIGHTRDRLWSQFRIDDSQEWSEQQRLEWQRENQRRRQEKARGDDERRRRSLSALQRHEQYTRLLTELTLHPDDRADLIRRGFTHEQIELSGFKSIGCYQQLRSRYNELLPGVSRGERLIIANEGYLCPVRNADGLIVACQVRLRTLPTTETSRYRWLSGDGQTLHLYPEGCKPGGELPLPVFRPQAKPEGIALAEGTGAKPFLVSERLNLFTIGAAGGQWASSPELFRSTLEKTGLEAETKEIKIFPDAGDILNQSVMNRWQRAIALLEEWGWEVAIGWWNQRDKSHPDIDELTDLSQIQYIKPEEFLRMSDIRHSQSSPDPQQQTLRQQRYIKPIQELPEVGFHVIRDSQDKLLERFDALKTKRGQEWLQLRKFTPDVTINSQYFDYDFKPGENLAIRSGLGTGKSYFTNAKWLANPDEGAVLGGYRNCLNEQFCANGEKLNGRPWYQIQSDLKNSQEAALISDPRSRIAGAVDSWIYFDARCFDGKKVIFDEVESVAKHLNQSSTAVSFYRDIIKQRVSDSLAYSLSALIADGNLTDFTVEYIEKLSGGKKFTKILNPYTGNRGRVYLYNGSSRKRKATEADVEDGLAIKVGDWISFDHKPDDYSQLHRIMVDLPTDIPLLILSDSQKKCEAWDRELTALGRKVFRLDSTTSNSDLGRQFLAAPKGFILSEGIDTVILSPSAESGVSIELADELRRETPGYFKYEFAFFFGVSVTDTQTQFLGRNRDPYTQKFVYVQTHSMPIAQVTNEENSKDILSMWVETMKDCASLSLQGIEEGEILKIASKRIEEKLRDPHTQYESKLTLKESFEREYPRLCLEYSLRESGWEVLTVESREDDLSDLRATEQEIAEQKAQAVFSAVDITPSEADQLARKLNKTPDERNQITKSRILNRLPGITHKKITVEKTIRNEEQLKQIEESESEKITTIGDLSYPEWQDSPSRQIPSDGVKVTVEKPAFDPDFINKVQNTDRACVSRLEMQFLLRNPEICKLIQQHKWHKKLTLLTDPDSASFSGLPVSRYRSKWLEVHTLYEMGIEFFLNPENKWHDETPEAISFWEKGRIPSNARNIGVKHEQSVTAYIGRVLKKYGLKSQGKQRRTEGKEETNKTRYREYSIASVDSLSQAIYECVEQRIKTHASEVVLDWKKIVENSAYGAVETLAEQELQLSHLSLDNLIKNQGEGVTTFEESQRIGDSLTGVPAVDKLVVENSAYGAAETLAEQESQLSHLSPDNLIKNQGEGVTTFEESQRIGNSLTGVHEVDELVGIFNTCDNIDDLTEVAKFYEPGELTDPARKEELIEAAILFSPLEIRSRLRRWWDTALHQVRDFWRELELGAARNIANPLRLGVT